LEHKISTVFEESTTMPTNNIFHSDCSNVKKPTVNDQS